MEIKVFDVKMEIILMLERKVLMPSMLFDVCLDRQGYVVDCNPPKPIDIKVHNTGPAGNSFTNWTPSNTSFGGGGSVSSGSFTPNIPTPPTVHIPSGASFGGGNSAGRSQSSISPQELHISSIVNTIKSSGGTVLGGISDSSRKKKGDVDVNYHLIKPIQRMHDKKVVGNEYLKGMVFHDCDLTGDDMDYIINMPDWVDYNFKIIDFSNNLGINDLGIYYALRGNIGHDDGIKYKGFLGRDRLHVVKLDLSNCNIGDGGASLIAEALCDGKLASTKQINLSGNKISDKGTVTIAEALKTGKFPTLKRFDISGNDTSLVTEKFMLDALKHPSTQSIILLLKRSNDLKVVLSGSKEEKQKLIKTTLQTAQDKGVDVKNIAVSKDITTKLFNLGVVIKDFSLGFTKCNIVPEDVETFAIDRITAKICKKTAAANAAKDAVVCFFDAIEDVSTSPEGVQLIKDLDLLGANTVIDCID